MPFCCCPIPWPKKKQRPEQDGLQEIHNNTTRPLTELDQELSKLPQPPRNNLQVKQPVVDTGPGVGLKILYDPKDAVVDIIAIHGLNGHRERTFTADNNVNWLSSLLPEQFPKVRVMTYGYDAKTHSSGTLTQEFLHGHAEQFVQDVTERRQDTETTRRPIIFVAHSLGGLVLKNALSLSSGYNQQHREDQMSFKISTYGILFMGTPHSGGQGARLGELAVNIASIWLNTNSQLLKHLQTNSEWLDQTQMRYLPISGDFNTKFFYEAYPTPTVGGNELLVVPKHSACIPGALDASNIRIQKNHVNMVKYGGEDDEDFQKICRQLKVMLKEAIVKVEDNWRNSDIVKRATGLPQVLYHITPEIPFSTNRNFIGREDVLKSIHEILQVPVLDGAHRNAVALYGMGGVGKTQIAIQYAHLYRKCYTSIWFVSAESVASLVEGLVRIGQKILQFHARYWGTNHSSISTLVGVRPDTVDDTTGKIIDTAVAIEAVKSWLAAEENQNWLLIVDNYDDLENVNAQEFLPNGNNGKLIITGRESSTGRLGTGIEIKAIDSQDGIELIRRCAQRSKAEFERERQFAGVVVDKLSSLPLALDQAGSFIFTSGISFEDFLTRFDEEFPNIMSKKPPKSVWQYDKTMFTTWEISFKGLSKEAQGLLLLCGFFNHDEILLDVLLQEEKLVEFGIGSVNAAIGEILSLSLGKRRSDINALWIHPLVHRWSRERPGTDQKRLSAQAIALTAGAIRCAPLDRKAENWILERQLMPHIHACVDHTYHSNYVEDLLPEPVLLGNLFYLAHALSENHDLDKAHALFDWLVPRMEKTQGVEANDTLFTMHYMAQVLSSRGRYKEALRLNQRVLAGREKVLGMDHSDTLESLHDIAYNLKQLGNSVEALKWYRRALEEKERVLGKEHQSTLGTLGNMAALLDDQRMHGEAMEMYLRVLEGQKRELGDEHPKTLNTMHGIASVLDRQGKYTEALEWNHKSLAGRKKVLGMEHQHTLTTMNNIGLVLKKQGNHRDALEWYQQALAGREKVLGANHPETLTSVNNIASLFHSEGEYEESLKWHQRAMEGREKSLGKEHPLTFQSYNNVAALYFTQGRYADALFWHEKTLAGREKVLGKDHFSTIGTVNNMAVTFYNDGQYHEATRKFERVLAWKESFLGSNHPDVEQIKNMLAECKRKAEE